MFVAFIWELPVVPWLHLGPHWGLSGSFGFRGSGRALVVVRCVRDGCDHCVVPLEWSGSLGSLGSFRFVGFICRVCGFILARSEGRWV